MRFPSFHQLSDRDLLCEVTRLAADERESTARLIASLAELDARRLYLGEGCSSLFTYCVHVLRLSEHATYDRIEVARAARRFPGILQELAVGAVTLTTIRLLAPRLTAENHAVLLAEARHRTRREVEQIVARLQPRPDVPSTVRKLPTPPPARRPDMSPSRNGAGHAAQTHAGPAPLHTTSHTAPPPAAPPPAPTPAPARPAVVAPLAPTRYKVSFTISAETYAKLQEAQALLRHVIPSGDPALVFDRALTLLVADCARTKRAATHKPRPRRPTPLRQAQGRLERSRETTPREASCSSSSPRAPAQDAPAAAAGAMDQRPPGQSRQIPAEVKRTVWARDGGQCAFVSASGRRCAEPGFLEFHHVMPYAKGGTASVDNIQLRCRQHNGYEAERDFGSWPLCVRETAPGFRVPPQTTWFETSMARSLRHALATPDGTVPSQFSHATSP